jgi:predicted RND superfamily exporter protein
VGALPFSRRGGSMSRLIGLAIRFPRATLAVLAAITAAFGLLAIDFRVDSSVDTLLPKDDPARAYYEEVKQVFGSDEATVIGVFADNVFALDTLAKIDRISKELAEIDGVREVLSITTLRGVTIDDVGALHVGPLMRELPTTPEAAEELRRRIVAYPLYAGRAVSADNRATGILVLYDLVSEADFISRDIEGQVRRIVDAARGPEDFAVTGIQTLKVNAARLMEEDLTRFLPVSAVVVVVVLIWAFRTVRGVALPMGAVAMGVVWTVGAMVLAGKAINLGTLVLPPLLMAIGIAYSIHIVSRYYQEVEPGRAPLEVVQATMNDLGLPVAVAALTTVIGFASLALSRIPAIRDFGMFSVVGIVAIFLLTVLFIPAALVLLPAPRRGLHHRTRDDWVIRTLRRLGEGAIRHRRLVFAMAVAACAFSLVGASRMRLETDYLEFISPTNPVRAENDRIARALGGTQPVYVVVDGTGPQSISQLETLQAIEDLEEFILEQPGVDSVVSVIDYLRLIRSALDPEAPEELPETQADVNQLLLFVGQKDIRPVANADFSRGNLIVGTRLSGSTAISHFVDRIEAYAKTRFRRDVEVRTTGTVVLLNRSADAVARGQIYGLVQVVVVLFIVMSVMLLSARGGAVSLIPNIAPIIILFGVMGWTGISLNISTSMIAGIAIGIAMDDTIHYLTAFNLNVRRSGSERQAILTVARSVGMPIVYTSVVLSAGFLVVCLSNFIPIRHFGLLSSATMVVGLFSDLVLMPALLMTAHVVTVWDLASLRLGSQPHAEIPLFANLRPFQAKIVVLMGQLARARPGDYIIRRGDRGEELYVLLGGKVDILGGDENIIRTLGRGDVIGEMALVRHAPRSADAVVRETTEYLVLDAAFLDRIQRRYPRIAATVFLNLTRILSDRLESTTNQLVASRAE